MAADGAARWEMQAVCRQCGEPVTMRGGRYGIMHADGCPATGGLLARWRIRPRR